ncbi:MAG: hypothetical protein KDD47_13045 [Acidobacteria bacterium]|nr:hypothetical protein [Acidobacteriota bacterium]
MKTMTKVMLQDLSRLWWIGLGWILIVSLKVLGFDARFSPQQEGAWQVLAWTATVLYWPWILNTALVWGRENSPFQENGFLHTRPAGRGSLAVAKTLSLALVLVVPLAVAQGFALRGFGLVGGRLWAALLESMVPDMAIAFGASLIALLSRSPKGFVALGVGLSSGYLFLRGYLDRSPVGGAVGEGPEVAGILLDLHAWAGWAVALGLVFALGAFGFLVRRRTVSIVSLAMAFFAVAWLQASWVLPIDAALPPRPKPPTVFLGDPAFGSPSAKAPWLATDGKRLRLVEASHRTPQGGGKEIHIVLDERTLKRLRGRSGYTSGFSLRLDTPSALRVFPARSSRSSGQSEGGWATSRPDTEFRRHDLTFEVPPGTALPPDWLEHAYLSFP